MSNSICPSRRLEDLSALADYQRATLPALSKAFVDEDFAFNGQYLSGQQEMEPRWERCVRATNTSLGMALGQLYVDRTFGPAGKERTLKMVKAIETAMHQDIQQLDWMSDTTKQQAYIKLNTIVNNIGYPDKWRDYSSVVVKRDDYAGNVAPGCGVRSPSPACRRSTSQLTAKTGA